MVQAGCVGCLLNSTARHLKGAVLVRSPAPRIKCPDKAIQGREGLLALTDEDTVHLDSEVKAVGSEGVGHIKPQPGSRGPKYHRPQLT